MSIDIEKEIRSTMEDIKKLKYEVGNINSRLSTISDRMSEPAYSKEFIEEFKKCCYRLTAPKDDGGISMRDMDCMFGPIGAYKVLDMYSAEEIVSKFREFDKKKELERDWQDRTLRMGDEVRFKEDHDHTGIVLRDSIPDNKHLSVWFANGTVSDNVIKNWYEKTGRHFDSIDYWVKTELKKEEK